MKKLPVGIQTFSQLIDEGYIYVDKTEDIYNLITGGGKYYFLSRPRRFGKSLLISTLAELFSGNKELFKGLWIYEKIDWREYPVLHIDFSKISYKTPEILEESLDAVVEKIASDHGIQLNAKLFYKDKFGQLIEKLAQKEKVAVLIDEYDKPIIDNIGKKDVASQNREILKEFYTVIKACDMFIKFAFITGVSKFSKVSVFSGLNNLYDITIDSKYAVMLGYTQEELSTYFMPLIEKMVEQEADASGAHKESVKADLVRDIKRWYNGYSWDGEHFVYNPLSVLTFFSRGSFGNYWFETGTPSFLIKLMKEYKVDVTQLEHYKAGEAIFESFDVEKLHVVSLLFQTGYLTVKEVQPAGGRRVLYVLSYPNMEVKESFLEHILGEYSSQFADEVSVVIFELRDALMANKMDAFFKRIQSIFAKISYDMFVHEREGFYQTVIYLILMLIGINVKTEIETNLGRIDAVVETGTHLYIMEFKVGTAVDALKQIDDKKYFQRYLDSSKEISLIGVGFDKELRNLKEYKIKTLSKKPNKPII